ncbi:hypothetical protein H9P43_006013 [Blastocladiella emersonii ATCC 22665]|nr:hypothetical protein H9P43_006013 [Blastocladiella emersonii ATCC 22665]
MPRASKKSAGAADPDAPAPAPAKRSRASSAKATTPAKRRKVIAPASDAYVQLSVDEPASFIPLRLPETPEQLERRISAERAASGWWVPLRDPTGPSQGGPPAQISPFLADVDAVIASGVPETDAWADARPVRNDQPGILDARGRWESQERPVLGELSLHAEPLLLFNRAETIPVFFDGEELPGEIEHRNVYYRLRPRAEPWTLDDLHTLKVTDFAHSYSVDPYFDADNHGLTSQKAFKPSNIKLYALAKLAGDAAFAAEEAEPAELATARSEPTVLNTRDFMARWAVRSGDLVLPKLDDCPAFLREPDLSFTKYLRILVRPVRNVSYPASQPGIQYFYAWDIVLRTADLNRDLRAHVSGAQRALHKIFQLFPVSGMNRIAPDTSRIFSSADHAPTWTDPAAAPDAAQAGVKAEPGSNALPGFRATLGSNDNSTLSWLVTREGGSAPRATKSPSDEGYPYIRLGPGGVLFNPIADEWAERDILSPSAPVEDSHSSPFDARQLMVGISTLSAKLMTPVLALAHARPCPSPAAVDVELAERGKYFPSRATLIVCRDAHYTDVLANVRAALPNSAEILAARHATDVPKLTLEAVQRADVVVLAIEALVSNAYHDAVAEAVKGFYGYPLTRADAARLSGDDAYEIAEEEGINIKFIFSQQLAEYVQKRLEVQRDNELEGTVEQVSEERVYESVKEEAGSGSRGGDEDDEEEEEEEVDEEDSDENSSGYRHRPALDIYGYGQSVGKVEVIFERIWFHRVIIFGSEEMVEEPRAPVKEPKPRSSWYDYDDDYGGYDSYGEEYGSDEDEDGFMGGGLWGGGWGGGGWRNRGGYNRRRRHEAALAEWHQEQYEAQKKYEEDLERSRRLAKILPGFRGSTTIHVTRSTYLTRIKRALTLCLPADAPRMSDPEWGAFVNAITIDASSSSAPYPRVEHATHVVQPSAVEVLLAHAAVTGTAPLTIREYLKRFQHHQLGSRFAPLKDGLMAVSSIARRLHDAAPAELAQLERTVATAMTGLESARAAVRSAVATWPAARRWVLGHGLSAADVAAPTPAAPAVATRATNPTSDELARLRSLVTLVRDWRLRLDLAIRKRDAHLAAAPLVAAAAALAGPAAAATLSCARCTVDVDVRRDAFAVAQCSHVLCGDCTDAIGDRCTACNRPVDAQFATRYSGGSTVMSEHGAKVDAIAAHIFSAVGEAEDTDVNVVVWTQYAGLAAALAPALKQLTGITLMDGTATDAASVKAPGPGFKERAKKPAVLVLHPESRFDEARLNLATHVVFAHPMLSPSALEARELEMQLLGKTVYAGSGQQRVHVARFVANGTAEVGMTAERTRVPWS